MKTPPKASKDGGPEKTHEEPPAVLDSDVDSQTLSLGRQVEVTTTDPHAKKPSRTPSLTRAVIPVVAEEDCPQVPEPSTDGGLRSDTDDDIRVTKSVSYARPPKVQTKIKLPRMNLQKGCGTGFGF